MKQGCFSVARSWVRMRVTEGCVMRRTADSQELLMQEDVPGCEGACEVSPVSGGDRPATGTWLGKSFCQATAQDLSRKRAGVQAVMSILPVDMTGQQQACGLVTSLGEAERPAAAMWFRRPCGGDFTFLRGKTTKNSY